MVGSFHSSKINVSGPSLISKSFMELEDEGEPETSFLSAAKAAPVATSPMSSPRANAGRVPTIYDQINKWFENIVHRRSVKSVVIAAPVVVPVMILSTVLLLFSLKAPIQFVYDVFNTLFSLSFYLVLLFQCTFLAGAYFCVYKLLIRENQLRRVSFFRFESWLCVFLLSLSNFAVAFSLLKTTRSEILNSRFYAFVVVLSSVLSSLSTVFRNDFLMNFAGCSLHPGWVDSMLSIFSVGGETVFSRSGREAVRLLALLSGLAFVFGIIMFGFSSFLFIFDINFYYTFGIILFMEIFIAKSFIKTIKAYIMEPISFPLPPQFQVMNPTAPQTRTLTNVLGNSQPLLTLFAFHDLRRIAWTDSGRRQQIFSLSQPGGHPRNWTAISSECLHVLEQSKAQLQAACAPFIAGNGLDYLDDEDPIDREMSTMSSMARKQIYSSAVRRNHRQRIFRPLAPRNQIVLRPTRLQQVIALLRDEKSIISRYEASITVLAIESLYMLVLESYTEDRYGVVLKDLKTILLQFLDLYNTIDKYFRYKASVDTYDVPIRQVESAVSAALNRVLAKFGPHLKSIDLSPEQIRELDRICVGAQ